MEFGAAPNTAPHQPAALEVERKDFGNCWRGLRGQFPCAPREVSSAGCVAGYEIAFVLSSTFSYKVRYRVLPGQSTLPDGFLGGELIQPVQPVKRGGLITFRQRRIVEY